jgi:hypothetical protein
MRFIRAVTAVIMRCSSSAHVRNVPPDDTVYLPDSATVLSQTGKVCYALAGRPGECRVAWALGPQALYAWAGGPQSLASSERSICPASGRLPSAFSARVSEMAASSLDRRLCLRDDHDTSPALLSRGW